MDRKKVKRVNVVWVLMLLLALMGGQAAIGLPGMQAEAATMLKVGLLQEPKTLNVMRASDRWSRRVLSLIYQSLYIRHPETLELIPWLASAPPAYDPASLSYTITLRPAKWSDGTELTSEDVAFTARLIQEFKVPRYASKWKFVTRIETPDKRTVKFTLKEPMAIFTSRTMATPIVQKKEWEKVAAEARKTEKPLASLLNHPIPQPVGSGPFVLREWKQGAYLFLRRNEHFFGSGAKIGGRTLGPHIQGIVFKFFGTSDAAVLALKKGALDMFWWGIEPGYLEDLRSDPDIEVFSNERSALYYMGFNVRKTPFSDRNLRRAVATLIDKDFILKRILQGNGEAMKSFVPRGNTYWYCPDVATYGKGLSREARIRAAYEILSRAGYRWEVPPVDGEGRVGKGEGLIMPDAKPMPDFTILTPPADYDPLRAMSGMIIQEWLKEIGIPARAKAMAFSALLKQVKVRREFDAFILAYGRLDLDPAWLRSFFHSRNDKPRGWNMSGYRNPRFDQVADASDRAVDRNERRRLVWEMQKILLEDIPYIPLYRPHLVEAVRKGRFSGWVNMLEGIGNTWSFCELKPE